MDHSLSQNAPSHWGYIPNNPTSWAPVSRPLKRSHSESDDCDDVYSEESSKDHCTSPGEAESCQMLSRKKRRGVIEKKRRDRINMSLNELKRLVPSAFEKQGSAKLEKAEILSMTVEHLKMLHAKGLDSMAFDPHKYAMDYGIMGFRECVAEVARYLERIEGLDVQNPLRLRLTSHLQCCAAQRELASKQANSTSWAYGSSQPYPPLNTLSPASTSLTHQPAPQMSHHPVQNIQEIGHYEPSSVQTSIPVSSTDNKLVSSSAPILTPLTSTTPSMLSSYNPQYPSHPVASSFSIPTTSHHQNYSQTIPTSQGMKPYRPWGTELAY